MTWRGRKVLVTGCTGFLGSWLTQALVQRGADVVGLVRDRVPESMLFRSGTADRINVVHGDLRDLELLRRTLGEYEIETVFHLGAQAIVGQAHDNPLETFESNVRGTWTLLEACRRRDGPPRVIVASSDKAYGHHDDLPYTEEFGLRGRHPYEVSKSCADLIAASYAHSYGLPVTVVRCGNLFGGGDLNWSRIIPGTIKLALEGERPIIRSDGTPLRDYVYVKDATQGYLRLASAMDDESIHGQAFNFGTGTPISVLDLVRKILRLAGREDLAPRVLDESRGEILHQYLSSAKAAKTIGWQADPDPEPALRETIEWYRRFLAAQASGAS